MGLHSLYFGGIQGRRKAVREAWEEKLRNNVMEIDERHSLAVPAEHVELFFEYLHHRERDYDTAAELLRTEKEALAYCKEIGVKASQTTTQSQDHY
jgi:hypothetical protein